MWNIFGIWYLVALVLGVIGAEKLIIIAKNIFNEHIGDNFRVWNWQRKGWMDKNHRFTDKMIQDYRRKHRL